MTITLTGIELERMEAIQEQFDYLLRRVGGVESETKIENYLKLISKKQIESLEFYGVPPGTLKARHALLVEIDWQKHEDLRSSTPFIAIPSYWGDGDNKKVNPDIRDEAQKFLKKCVGLEIKFHFTWGSISSQKKDELRKLMGTSPVAADEKISPPSGNFGGYSIIDLEEVSIKTNK